MSGIPIGFWAKPNENDKIATKVIIWRFIDNLKIEKFLRYANDVGKNWLIAVF
jgi:hypothetical protein